MAGSGQATAPVRAAGTDVERLRSLADDGSIFTLVNDLVAKAVEVRASHVHVEAMEGEVRVRFRLDRLLRT